MEVAPVRAHKDRGVPLEAGRVPGLVERHRQALPARRRVPHAVRGPAVQHVGPLPQKLRGQGSHPGGTGVASTPSWTRTPGSRRLVVL